MRQSSAQVARGEGINEPLLWNRFSFAVRLALLEELYLYVRFGRAGEIEDTGMHGKTREKTLDYYVRRFRDARIVDFGEQERTGWCLTTATWRE